MAELFAQVIPRFRASAESEELNWLNAQYIKKADDAFLAAQVANRLARRGVNPETGVSLDDLPYIAILGAVALIGVALLLRRRFAGNRG